MSPALEEPARAAARECARLKTLLAGEPSPDRFGALGVVTANLSHLLAYLDGNAPFLVAGGAAGDIRALLESGPFLDWCASCLDALPPGAATPEIAARWSEWIEAGRSPAARRDGARINDRLAALDDAVRESEAMQRALMDRLGAPRGPSAAAFLARACGVGSPATRWRLSTAWTLARDASAPALQAGLDALVDARFEAAHRGTRAAPLDATLCRGTLGRAELQRFLVAYRRMAAETDRTLARRIGARSPDETALAAEAPAYLVRRHPGASGLRLPLAPALDMIAEITARALGVQLERDPATPTRLTVRSGAGCLGRMELDGVAPWAPARTAHSRPEQARPTVRVLCRTDERAPSSLGFESLRAVFHEIGHGLAHLAAGPSPPSLSGLEALPLERLELLSTWFEHWIYHPELETRLQLGPQDRRALAFARRAKVFETQRSCARRALCAELDLELHAAPGRSVATAWRALQERGPDLTAGRRADVLTDFAHPLLRRHPGAGFVYPLAQCFAAERFLPMLDQPIDALHPARCGLEPAVRADRPLPLPDPDAPRLLFEKLNASLLPESAAP